MRSRGKGGRALSPACAHAIDPYHRYPLFLPTDRPGHHSVWCELALVEAGCRPVAARNVVCVVADTKLFLRITATGFLFTILYTDITSVRHIVETGTVELHAAIAPLSREAMGEAGMLRPPQRLYVLRPKHATEGEQLYAVLLGQIPREAQQQSKQLHVGQSTLMAREGTTRSLLTDELLRATGLEELATPLSPSSRSSGSLPSPSSSSSPVRYKHHHTAFDSKYRKAPSATAAPRQDSAKLPGFSPTTPVQNGAGPSSPQRSSGVHFVAAPPFWHLSSQVDGPKSSTSTFSHRRKSVGQPHHHCHSNTNSRDGGINVAGATAEDKAIPDSTGRKTERRRPLVVPSHDSSRLSAYQETAATLSVKYGPTILL